MMVGPAVKDTGVLDFAQPPPPAQCHDCAASPLNINHHFNLGPMISSFAVQLF